MEVAMVMKQEEVLMQKGYDIGIGVAMATGSPMALGTTGEVTAPQFGTGGSGSFTFSRLETSEDLETALGIEADVSAGIGLFRGSASLDFAKQCRIQSSSLCVMVSAREDFAFKQMDSPALSPAAATLVENGNMEQFANQFGEYFIRGMSTGGRFLGVIRIETKSTQSKLDVDSALSASYGFQVDADVKLKIRETLKTANARIDARYIFDGGEVKTRITSSDPLTALEELYQAMDEWTATVRKDPKAYSVTLAPYIIALGPLPPNLAEIEHQRDVLIRCAKLRSQTMDKLNLIDYILDPDHRGEFEIVPPPEGPDLPELQARLAGDLDVIGRAASFAINNVKQACDPVTFMREIQGVPDFVLTALPQNLPEHTGGLLAAPSIRVPNMIGIDNGELCDFLQCINIGSVNDCLAGTVLTGEDGIAHPISTINREAAQFLADTKKPGMPKVTFSPDVVCAIPADENDPLGMPWAIVAQSPNPGDLVSEKDEVILHFALK
jgi:hypothetical protein